jgi:hypothetical protein
MTKRSKKLTKRMRDFFHGFHDAEDEDDATVDGEDTKLTENAKLSDGDVIKRIGEGCSLNQNE